MINLTIIIPCREKEDAKITLNSLSIQTYQAFKTIVVKDKGNGANWARNQGFWQIGTEFCLFSDNDISWKPNAIKTMMDTLKMTKASYCYGRYMLGDTVWSHEPWDAELLKHHNYISTMSLFRTADLPRPPFDENLKRLQDWDLYLNMLINHNKRGVYCEDLVFTTKVRPGITYNENLDPVEGHDEAFRKVKEKYNL